MFRVDDQTPVHCRQYKQYSAVIILFQCTYRTYFSSAYYLNATLLLSDSSFILMI